MTRIARRLATIEASTWKDDNDFNKFHGEIFERLKESKAEALECQAKKAFDNTSGGNTHSLFADGKWHRCRDCPGIAHIKNMGYWANKKCSRAVKRSSENFMDKAKAGVKRFLDNPKAEEFRICSEDEDDERIVHSPARHDEVASQVPVVPIGCVSETQVGGKRQHKDLEVAPFW